MSEEGVAYRGYHLDVHRFGPGWRVRIYGPDDQLPMHQTPETRLEDGKDQVVRQARHIVDQDIRAMEQLPPVTPTEQHRLRRRWLNLWRKRT